MIVGMEIRRLGPQDTAEYQALRLRGLRECPEAFGSTYEEDAQLSLDVVAARLQAAVPPRGPRRPAAAVPVTRPNRGPNHEDSLSVWRLRPKR